MDRFLMFCGALVGFGAVALAAAASHVLPARLLPREMEMVRAAVQMAGWHAPVILLCGLLARSGFVLAGWAGWLFLAGVALFCGGVGFAAGGVAPSLGRLAPVGGTLLLAGWALLSAAALRR